jgi:hypothetical protein
MGAGNPKLSSFDSDKFEPITYFLDLSEDEEAIIKNLTEENGEEPDDDFVERERAFLEEMHFDDLIESICSELNHTPWDLQSSANGFGELTYAFRESGLIMTEGKLCYVITETSAEYYHLPIGVIPNFKFETFLEDAEFEMEDKREWYDARGKSLAAAIDKLANRNWEKKMKEFHKEAATVLQTLHGWYGEKMSGRCGAWTSGPVDPAKLAA